MRPTTPTQMAFTLAVLAALAAPAARAQTPTVLWATDAGGFHADGGTSIASANDGAAFLLGHFQGVTQFGPNTLVSTVPNLFLTKLSEAGEILWARQAGGNSASIVETDLASDPFGNAIITGDFDEVAVFAESQVTGGGREIFLAKYDPSGNLLWAQNIGTAADEFGASVATGSDGSIFVTGTFQGTLIVGNTSLTSANLEAVFLAKLDGDGEVIWTRKIDKSDGDISFGPNLAVDPSGSPIVAGRFLGTLDFRDTTLTSQGSQDVYVAKYDGDGNFQWARGAGGIGSDSASGIAADFEGSISVSGAFRGALSFGPFFLNSTAGSQDLFVAKYNADGDILWARQGVSTSDAAASSVTIGSAGNVVIGGLFQGTLAFDELTLESGGSLDGFLASYSHSGVFLGAIQATGPESQVINSLASDDEGGLLAAGSFVGESSFDALSLTDRGATDAFAARLVPSVTAVDPSARRESDIRLTSQPNPFTSKTRFALTLPRSEHLTIRVYDARGRLVAELADQEYPAGQHLIDWSGNDDSGRPTPPGVLFLSLRGRTTSLHQKLVRIP